MGFYPKRLRRARYRFIMRCISNAALAGATFERYRSGVLYRWCVTAVDNSWCRYYDSKGAGAVDFLFWHFNKVGITPAWGRDGFAARSGNYGKRRGAARRIDPSKPRGLPGIGLRSSLHG